MAELRESDSYRTDSEGEGGDEPFKVANHEMDNTVIKMANSLLAAAKWYAARGDQEFPQITVKLPRLHPGSQCLPYLRSLGLKTTASFQDDSEPSGDSEPRIGKTIETLLKMNIDVELGERPFMRLSAAEEAGPEIPPAFAPSCCVNVDLTVLIALASDLSHASLPSSTEQAHSRFRRDSNHPNTRSGSSRLEEPEGFADHAKSADSEGDGQHARALTGQLLQEMRQGLLENLKHQLSRSVSAPQRIEFWTTLEARDRCIRIVAQIGGSEEKRRVQAMFCNSLGSEPSDLSNNMEILEYWHQSRYSAEYLPFIPIQLFDRPASSSPQKDRSNKQDPFFALLERTCLHLLSSEEDETPSKTNTLMTKFFDDPGDIRRAAIVKSNPRLTVHTVRSMLWGASLGWTTLTANKASVQAILREMKNLGRIPLRTTQDKNELEVAAIWLLEPRSLAEGMRTDVS